MKKKTDECDVDDTRICNPCCEESVLPSSGIVALLHAKARFSRHPNPPAHSDWKRLAALAREQFPLLAATMQNCKTISRQEGRICILVRLGFSTSETAILLQTSIQRVSNAKASANWKLFGERKAATLRENLLTVE